MRRIVVSVQNGLLSEALTELLRSSGEFEPHRVETGSRSAAVSACAALSPEVVLMEASAAPGASVADRLEEIRQIRKLAPGCRAVLLCDENGAPDIAREVVSAKKNGGIDAFYYSSVTGKYLVASLCSL